MAKACFHQYVAGIPGRAADKRAYVDERLSEERRRLAYLALCCCAVWAVLIAAVLLV